MNTPENISNAEAPRLIPIEGLAPRDETTNTVIEWAPATMSNSLPSFACPARPLGESRRFALVELPPAFTLPVGCASARNEGQEVQCVFPFPQTDKFPREWVDDLRLYTTHARRPPEFLLAVLCNDLARATSAGSLLDMTRLPDLVDYCSTYLPCSIYGESGRVRAWLLTGDVTTYRVNMSDVLSKGMSS